jgi:hypothetical protein
MFQNVKCFQELFQHVVNVFELGYLTDTELGYNYQVTFLYMYKLISMKKEKEITYMSFVHSCCRKKILFVSLDRDTDR